MLRVHLQFENTIYLWGLALLPMLVLLFLYLLRWKRTVAARLGDPGLIATLTVNDAPRQRLIRFLLLLLALVLLFMALAGLRKPGKMADIKRKGVDMVLAIDVSKSMLAADIKPNRLERARELCYKIIEDMPDDRIGLVLFAGRAYMQMPLSTDHAAARMFLQNASPESVPAQGTVLAEALSMSNAAFNDKERKFKSILLITDGEDHDPEALDIAKNLAESGVIINTVGIGSAAGAPIIDPTTGTYKKDEQGNTIISKLNEAELSQLAAISHGVYIHYSSADAAVAVIRKQLSGIQQTYIEDNHFMNYQYFFQWFLAMALLTMLTEFFMPERKWKKG